MKKPRKAEGKHSVDRVMYNTMASLIRDSRECLADPSFCSPLLTVLREKGEAKAVRDALPAVNVLEDDPYKFKWGYQLSALAKRHRFHKDTYTLRELRGEAIKKFISTQARIRSVDFSQLGANSNWILNCARTYISNVLGKYDEAEHRSLCRFGKKASVGIPLRDACEAARWRIPMSGSKSQIAWFDEEIRQVPMFQEYLDRQLKALPGGRLYMQCDSLKLTLVPKTFKSLRAIMPNTTIGGYMTYGLGLMIRRRLTREGYDVAKLQDRHKYLAKEASIHGTWATADLSSASDSISVALVERLFPADWLEILNLSRIPNNEVPGIGIIPVETYCTMGVGYTFPLQTLVFLALLKAIQACYFLPSDRRLISVYGDDMIYASRMHWMVSHHFAEFGFLLNEDKTFTTGAFRESCGGDYHRGVDVRPFSPEGGSHTVGDRAYEAVFYRFINGLLRRWSEHEIGITLRYLAESVEHHAGAIKLVPADYPDDAGVRCVTFLSPYEFLRGLRVTRPARVENTRLYKFPYLRKITRLRKEDRHEPYYWLALRGHDDDMPYHHRSDPEGTFETPDDAINWISGLRECAVPLLVTRKRRPKLTKMGINGERFECTVTYSTISGTGRYQRQFGYSSSWMP